MKKTKVRQWLKHGAIEVNGRSITRFNHALQRGDVIAIVEDGHSWGADTAAEVVGRLGQQGRPIDMLVTADPVGRGLSEDFMRRVRAGSRLSKLSRRPRMSWR